MIKKMFFVIFFCFVVCSSVFADGAYVDLVYSYSVTIKTPSNNIIILQCKNPIFVSSLNNGVYVNGDYRAYQMVLSTSTPSYTNSTVAVYTLQYTYFEILESSTDLFDFYTKEVIFQSEETDNVVISNEVIQEFRDYFETSNQSLADTQAIIQEFKDTGIEKLTSLNSQVVNLLALLIVSFISTLAFRGFKL